MSETKKDNPQGRIESVDRTELEARLREVARAFLPDRIMDDLEVGHLVRVITECSMLLTDVYSEERIARIVRPKRGFLSGLVEKLIRKQKAEGQGLLQIRRLPDEVRLVGDKALFDLGLLGRRQVKGYDLADLGALAYQRAGEALELLAEDRRLREFFKQNRLLMLPLEEEVVFLHRCSEKFRLYADILRQTHGGTDDNVERSVHELVDRVPLMAAAAEALREQQDVDAEDNPELEMSSDHPYLAAARGAAAPDAGLSKQQILSRYERILLFSSLDLAQVRQALDRTVIDQEKAVERLCDEFSLFAAGTRDPRKPPAYFMVGPTGVGKNHLVESLCRTLEGIWDVEVPMLTIEGPNFTYPSDINELRGATRGFIRSDEEGILTAFHARSSQAPLSVILVDEVEKAHPHLLTFFLSILDRGTTTDNRGNELNFSNCILFFTSNLGYSDAQQQSAPIGYMDDDARQSVSDQDVRRTLRGALTPEFMNRVRMIHFNRLTESSAERILSLELARIGERYADVHDLKLELDPSASEELIRRGFSATFGARHLASTLEAVCNVQIAQKIRKDDRRADKDRHSLIEWLRQIREGQRAFEPAEVKARVMETARASLDYDVLRIVFRDGAFEYEGVCSDPGGSP